MNQTLYLNEENENNWHDEDKKMEIKQTSDVAFLFQMLHRWPSFEKTGQQFHQGTLCSR